MNIKWRKEDVDKDLYDFSNSTILFDLFWENVHSKQEGD